MRKAVIYARVSTDEQAKEGKSIEAQLLMSNKWVFDNGCEVDCEFKDEGRSGTDFNRPALQDMLLRCAKGDISYVVVQDMDRLARDTLDYLLIKRELQKYKIELVSLNQPMINESPEGRYLEEIMAANNALSPRITGRKARSVMAKKFEMGWYPSYAPIGYKNSINDTPSSSLDRNIVIPDQNKADLIKFVFEEYAKGKYSILELTHLVGDMGLRNLNSSKMHASGVQHILTNPFYYGLMQWGGMEKMGKHEPLITKYLYGRCQHILAKHRNFLIRQRKHNFLLRGFIVCKKCGWRYVAEWHPINSKVRSQIAYYHCSNAECRPKKYVEVSVLEKNIEDLFLGFQFTQEFINAVSAKAKEHFNGLKSEVNDKKQIFVNQKTVLEAKRDKLETGLLDDTIDRETFKRLHVEVQRQIDGVGLEIERLENARNIDFKVVEEVLALTRDVYNAYKDAEVGLKRKYLKFFFERIKVEDGAIVDVKANPLFESLRQINQEVILNANWLRR